MNTHTTRCVARHTGIWMVEPEWFQTQWAAVRSGAYRMLTPESAAETATPAHMLTPDGIALVDVTGMMIKGASKFGNVDTTALRGLVRQLGAEPDVRGIVLRIDSPGGTFAGTDELASDVATVAKSKPVYAHIEDLGASAAYYLASQTGYIGASRSSQVGSIGTLLVVEDSSKAAEMDGIKVHVIATGEFKGATVEGAPVADATLDYLRERVGKVNQFFQNAVKKGRGMSEKRLAEVSDGRVWFADEALGLGLIDGVHGFDGTVDAIRAEVKARDKAAKARAKMDTARLRG